MCRIEYSTLKYYSNILFEECLYVGILFHNLTTDKRDFRYISNFRRFQAFDDEADVEFVKLYLTGIKQQVENSLLNFGKPFSISEYARIYVNEFKFSEPIIVDVEDDEDYVEKFTKMYLKFDFNKKDRLKVSEEKKIIRRVLSSSKDKLLSPKIIGSFDEKVNFDYIVGNVAIKLFTFKEKDPAKLIPSAKQWAFSADELKERYNIVFLYDEPTDTPHFKTVLNILNKHARVYQLQDGLEYILKEVA